jgi:hypothetical protein
MSAWTYITHIDVPSAGSTQFEFTNIPQLYDDLVIKASVRNSSSNFYDDIDISFNGESSRSWRALYYVPTSVASNASVNFNIVGQTSGTPVTASNFTSMDIYIPNYRSTGLKAMSSDAVIANNSATQYAMVFAANSITNGAAITQINLFHAFGVYNFVQFSSATLYGITKGSSGGVTVS